MKKIIAAYCVLLINTLSLQAQVTTDTSKAGGRGGTHGNVPMSTIAGSITFMPLCVTCAIVLIKNPCSYRSSEGNP